MNLRRRGISWLLHLPLLVISLIALASMMEACVGGGGSVDDGYGFYP